MGHGHSPLHQGGRAWELRLGTFSPGGLIQNEGLCQWELQPPVSLGHRGFPEDQEGAVSCGDSQVAPPGLQVFIRTGTMQVLQGPGSVHGVQRGGRWRFRDTFPLLEGQLHPDV